MEELPPEDEKDTSKISFVCSADKKTWHYGEEPLPFTCYNLGDLMITDEELLEDRVADWIYIESGSAKGNPCV